MGARGGRRAGCGRHRVHGCRLDAPRDAARFRQEQVRHGVFGIQTTSFAALIAAGGLAIGLAFQGTPSNFAANVMLLVFRPFKVDDLIHVGGILGVVQEIELFTCELSTLDNRKIIVPNSAIFGATIRESSRDGNLPRAHP